LKHTRIIKIYSVLIVISVLFLLYINYQYTNTEVDHYKWNEIRSFDSGWDYETEDGTKERIDLPLNKAIEAGKMYVITKTLPDYYPEGSVLCVKNNHTTMNVYINGELSYSIGVDDRNTIGKSPGCVYSLIPLTIDNYGKEVKIEYIPVYKRASLHISGFLLGERTTIVTGLIRQNILSVILCALTAAVGIVLIACYYIRLAGKDSRPHLLYMGFFTLTVSVWSLFETQIMQFFISNVYVLQYITYISLALIPIPALIYYAYKKGIECSKTVTALSLFSVISILLSIGLQCTGTKDLPETVFLAHINIALCTVYVITGQAKRYFHSQGKHRKHMTVTSMGVLILGATIMIDILRYYFKLYNDYAKFVRIGFFIYIICIGYDLVIASIDAHVEIEKLEDIVFADPMTGLLNRTAYENKIGELQEKSVERHSISVAKIRIMGLAQTELTYGSKAKEEIIRTAARLINLSFRSTASCYHASEDEFVIIMEDAGIDAEVSGFSYLRKRLYNCNKSRGEKIRLIYALEHPDQDGMTIKDLIANVDEALNKESQEENE